MNGRDTVTLDAGGSRRRVRFLGAGAAADLPPFVGAFQVAPVGGEGETRDIRVALDLDFLWAADADQNADEAAERLMRTVGLLCIEAHLKGSLPAGQDGALSIRDFIGSRYPDYTSVERFVGSLDDSPGRIERLSREDLLRCLVAHAEAKASEKEPTGPGLTVLGFQAWPEKRRFYDAETVRDAVLAWETEGLVETVDDRARIRPDRLDEARALLA